MAQGHQGSHGNVDVFKEEAAACQHLRLSVSMPGPPLCHHGVLRCSFTWSLAGAHQTVTGFSALTSARSQQKGGNH